MSQETVDAFRRGIAAYNRGDWDAALADVDPKVEFDLTRAAPDGKTYRGYEGVREFWEMLRDVFGDFRIDAEEIIDCGDMLLSRVRLQSVGKTSGVRTEDILYQISKLREGRVIRVKYFRERGEALKAVGRGSKGWPLPDDMAR
jgi:ketosteroid isomerase-like protein